MSIQHPDSVGKVHKIFRFEAVFHASASDCTKLTLGLEQTYAERNFLERVKATNFGNVRQFLEYLVDLESLQDIGLIYLGSHGSKGSYIGSPYDPINRITATDLEALKKHDDPRPIVFANLCDSGRLRRHNKNSYTGLLEVLLARFASGFIGTLGPIGSFEASSIAQRILYAAHDNPEGVHVAEILRQLRVEALQKISRSALSHLDQQEKSKRQLFFLYTYMYVYFGSPFALYWLLGASVPKKRTTDGFYRSCSLHSTHQPGDDLGLVRGFPS